MSEVGVAVVGLAMAAGLVGTFVPVLPGLLLIWGAAAVYGMVEGFEGPGWVAMALITAFLVAGTVAKLIVPQRRASAAGAHRSSMLVAAVAAIVGFFVIPVVGLPLGGMGGLLVAEYRRSRDWSIAWRSTKSALIGLGIGSLVELGAGLAMVACWVVWVLLRS